MAQIVRPTTFLFDGQKAVAIADLPDSAWTWYTAHLTKEDRDTKEYYLKVPWLSRGVALRSQAVAALPFALVDKGGEDYDSSTDWQNKVGFLANPSRLLYLVESSLSLLGKAYLFRSQNRVKVLDLMYHAASTITPQCNELAGLTGFQRQLGSTSLPFTPDDYVYFWTLDPFVEVGPGNNSPATAALSAAGVLYNVDEFAASFFERGAIKITLLTVKGSPPEAEKTRLKAWWERVAQGIGTAWGKEIVSAEGIEPVVVGEGIKELADSELTKEKREDIATALGIPMTLLWSSSAGGLGGGGVVSQDDKHFYTKTVVPEAEFIEGVLNEQLFTPMGLRWEFRPQTLDVFQEDENERSQAFVNYVNANMRPSVAAEILGIELPAGMEYADLDEHRAEDKQPVPAAFAQQQGSEDEALDKEAKADLKRWCKKALKRGADAPFESRHIPDDVARQVKAMLDGATTEDEIKAAFDSAEGVALATTQTVAEAEEGAMLAQIHEWYGKAQASAVDGDEATAVKKKNRPAGRK